MKKFLLVFSIFLSALFVANTTSAQGLRIGANGLEYGDYTPKKDSGKTTTFHYAAGPRNGAFYIGSKTLIPTVEVGWNMLADQSYGAYNGTEYGEFFDIHNWKSTQVTVNLLGASVHTRNKKFGVDVALGIRANNYRLDSDMTLGRGALVHPLAIEQSVKKSKFNTAALHIPIEAWIGRAGRFAFSMGGYVDMVMNSHTKIKYTGGKKDKVHNFPVNFIQAGVTARVSMFGISVYGQYTPTQLFKAGRGPEMSQWTIGIGF